MPLVVRMKLLEQTSGSIWPKSKRYILLLALIVALVAIAIPVLFAIDQSKNVGIKIEMDRMLSIAKDVLRRSDGTADQVEKGIKKLETAGASNPCSDSNLAIMRDIDLSSSYIQTVGHVSHDKLKCSSLVNIGSEIYLGSVDHITSKGVRLRLNLKLPSIPKTTFLTIERNGYIAIIDNNLPIDATEEDNDVSLMTFSLDNDNNFTSRGIIDPAWIRELKEHQETTFVKNGYVVAIVKSKKYLIGALAAHPVSYLDRIAQNIALVLVPVGLLAGSLLAIVIFYTAKQQMSIPTALKNALKRKEFFLEYQPIVNLQTREWVGVEALIRWRLPNGNIVRPDLFIPIAEECGIIKRITKRMIELVALDVGNLFRLYPDFHISINLSAADLHSKHIVEQICSLIKASNANPKNLIVEVTERGFLNAELALEVVQEIRASGVRVAIDDFGTGYSSLSYLGTFKIDFLKIDKLFVDTLGIDAPTSNVVSHIIEMAKTLNLEMIAEGIETEAQAKFLLDHGVQYGQGWLFGKPTAMTDVISKLQKHKHLMM